MADNGKEWLIMVTHLPSVRPVFFKGESSAKQLERFNHQKPARKQLVTCVKLPVLRSVPSTITIITTQFSKCSLLFKKAAGRLPGSHQLRPDHPSTAVPGHPLGIPQIQRRRRIQPLRSDELALTQQEMGLNVSGPTWLKQCHGNHPSIGYFYGITNIL